MSSARANIYIKLRFFPIIHLFIQQSSIYVRRHTFRAPPGQITTAIIRNIVVIEKYMAVFVTQTTIIIEKVVLSSRDFC